MDEFSDLFHKIVSDGGAATPEELNQLTTEELAELYRLGLRPETDYVSEW